MIELRFSKPWVLGLLGQKILRQSSLLWRRAERRHDWNSNEGDFFGKGSSPDSLPDVLCDRTDPLRGAYMPVR